jgi:hypothetical protein
MVAGAIWLYAVKRRHGTLSLRALEPREAGAT